MGPSASAHLVALIRARLERPHTPDGDLDAEDRFHASLAADQVPFERFLAARTEFFDQELLGALRAGVAQVVILGAGYDARALRFKSPGVRFVEVDLPGTQADKVRRLRELGVSVGHIDFAAADLTADPVRDVLSRTAYDPLRPAVFLCEGVLLYLPRAAVTTLLTDLRSAAAPGSLLLVSIALAGGTPVDARIASRLPPRRHSAAERRQSFYTPGRAAELLRGCGWRPERTGHPDQTRTENTDIALFVRAIPST
jgi:methyltransferase (TIGR00027 family)